MISESQNKELKQRYCPEGSNLRHLQMEILKVLCSFDKICRENNLRYSLCAGTLLGAIRHKGFIPWDDDADVMMPREDYDKLIQILQSYIYIYIYNRKSGPIACIPGSGAFIDIMIVDSAPNNSILRYLKRMVAKLVVLLIGAKTYLQDKRYKQKLKLKLLLVPFVYFFSMERLYAIQDLIIRWNGFIGGNGLGEQECKYRAVYTDIPSDIGKEIDSHVFEEYMDIEFENHTFRSIRQYDKYLKRYYGDYMSLPKQIQTHGRAK